MTMYYSEVDGTEPTVSIQIKDSRYTLTSESLIKLIEEKDALKLELAQVERKFKSAQFDVREFFQSRYEVDHHEIVADVDDVNSLLVNIGSEELTKSWSATVTITATVTGIEAPNAEAAQEIIENNIEINLTEDGDIEGDDLADLRAGKKTDEAVAGELPKAQIPSAVKQRLGVAIDKIKDAKLNPIQKLQLVAQVVDAIGVDKSQLGQIATKIRNKMENLKK